MNYRKLYDYTFGTLRPAVEECLKKLVKRHIGFEKSRIYSDLVISPEFTSPIKFKFSNYGQKISLESETCWEKMITTEFPQQPFQSVILSSQHNRLVREIINRSSYSLCQDLLAEELPDLTFEFLRTENISDPVTPHHLVYRGKCKPE